ncbi:transposase, IS605 OrfB family [Methanothermobacter sp. MT-2]|nr:transposase, IS605 OrfB family [Methanothermobacter sp. MT-2]
MLASNIRNNEKKSGASSTRLSINLQRKVHTTRIIASKTKFKAKKNGSVLSKAESIPSNPAKKLRINIKIATTKNDNIIVFLCSLI